MAKTSMNVNMLLNCVPHLPDGISVLLRGNHGIGKSSLVKQLAHVLSKKNGVEYEIIDRRLSQFTEGDMLGLPSIKTMHEDSVTSFNPPEWYKTACVKPCVLFLDELNRATHEVMQASFQVVLDRELNGWKLHPMTRVFAAVNIGGGYAVNEMDPAMLSRFWCIDLDVEADEWLNWARAEKLVPVVIDFIAGAKNWLDPSHGTDLTSVHPTRRAWERLSISLQAAGVQEEPENPLFYGLALGFVGTEASIALQTFAKDAFSRVTPQDIIESYTGLTETTAKKKGKKAQAAAPAQTTTPQMKVQRMTIDRQAALIDALALYITDTFKESETKKGTLEPQFEDRHGNNLLAFVRDISDELKVSLWTKTTEYAVENIPLLKVLHKHLVDEILWVWRVKADDPNSKYTQPEFLAKKEAEEKAKQEQPLAESAE